MRALRRRGISTLRDGMPAPHRPAQYGVWNPSPSGGSGWGLQNLQEDKARSPLGQPCADGGELLRVRSDLVARFTLLRLGKGETYGNG